MEEELSLIIKKSHSEIYEWEQPDELPALRVIYNDAQLKIHQKREIKRLNSEKKKIIIFKENKRKQKMQKSF